MISESKAREIDYYFVSDHRARRITFVIASSIGFISYFFCRMKTFSESVSICVAAFLIIATFLIRIAVYQSPSLRQSRARTTFTRRNNDPFLLRAKEMFFGGVLDRPDRRWILVRLAVLAVGAGLLVLGNQRLTEAEAVNEAIARLRRSGRVRAAQT